MNILSELLTKLMLDEKKVMNNNPVKHPTLIGSMYEGATKKILKKIDFSHPDLKVVSGIITSGDNHSGQIDCMVVIGEGERITNTDDFFYPIDKVIAVFEIKKNLFSREIDNVYQHLNAVFQLSKLDYQVKQDEGTLNFNTTRPAQEFVNLFGVWPCHYEENDSLPLHQRVVYQSLVRDWLTPLRIAMGYNGFKSEDALRASVHKIYENKEFQPGYGMQNMPNLLISDGYSLIKMNGMPYKGFWNEEHGWCWLGSSNANPILLIMELLFDRVQLLLGIKPDRGDDQNEEVLYPLILSKPVVESEKLGWYTFIIQAPVPERQVSQTQWSPIRLSLLEKDLLGLLHKHGPLEIKGDILCEYKSKYELDNVFEAIQSLLDARVVLATDEQLYICSGKWSVAKVCGSFYCGDNSDERFEHWVKLNTTPPWQMGKIYIISPSPYGPPTLSTEKGLSTK